MLLLIDNKPNQLLISELLSFYVPFQVFKGFVSIEILTYITIMNTPLLMWESEIKIHRWVFGPNVIQFSLLSSFKVYMILNPAE